MTAYERMGARIDRAGAIRRETERAQALAAARFRVGDTVAVDARRAGFPYPGEMVGRVAVVEPTPDGRIYYQLELEGGHTLVSNGADLRPVDQTEEAFSRLAAITSAKLGDRAQHLLKEIANGRNRIFAADLRPPGWLELERQGLAVKSDKPPGDRAELTPAGKAEAVARGFV